MNIKTKLISISKKKVIISYLNINLTTMLSFINRDCAFLPNKHLHRYLGPTGTIWVNRYAVIVACGNVGKIYSTY